MKNLMNLFLARGVKFDLALTAFVFAAFVLGCGGGGGTPPPAAYTGVWTGQDGTTMTIRGDGTGDYKAGSTNVSGAAVNVDEAAKELNFTLLGANVGKFKIDAAPAGGQMKLNGVAYRSGTGGATAPAPNAPSASPKPTADDDDTK